MSAASLDVLLKRLKDLNAESKSDSAEDVADAITSHVLSWALCSRLTVNGKAERGTFANYYAAVFGKTLDGKEPKWGTRG